VAHLFGNEKGEIRNRYLKGLIHEKHEPHENGRTKKKAEESGAEK
jgi:hypothetical protein